MRSVPDTLRNAATLLLERVRVGLDIPSRAEVMDLAERISTIAETIEALEIRRNEDSQVIAELKGNAKNGAAPRPLKAIPKPASNGESAPTSSLAQAAANLSGRPKARAEFTPLSTPASKKAAAKSGTKKAKAGAKPKARAGAAKKKGETTRAKSPASKAKAKPTKKAGAATKKAKTATKRKSSK